MSTMVKTTMKLFKYRKDEFRINKAKMKWKNFYKVKK